MGEGNGISAEKTVTITMFGDFRIQSGDHLVTDALNRSQKLWSVLCYLIAHRDRTVPQSELIDLFWPDEGSANPGNALKTLLYRVRFLLSPLFDGGPDPILSQRGSYSWNPAVLCRVDADQFESLVRQAADERLPAQVRIELYRQAAELYRGDYLPKLVSQMWVVPLSAHYHSIYLSAMKAYALLLEEESEFAQMVVLCQRASAIDPLDEELHVFTVRALLRQGKNTAALSCYQAATELLYRSLGVRPCQALRALYREIMSVEQALETDLESIQCNLSETASQPGAFLCEYGFFQEAYHLEARRAARSGICVHVVLITLSLPDGGVPPLNALNTAMDQLRDTLLSSLRRGDVVSKYSGAQYVVMLPAANFEDSTLVMDRIAAAFSRRRGHGFLKLTYKIREMGLT